MDGAGCEYPTDNATPDEIAAILRTAKVIAMVGLSADPDRDSNSVARYLLNAGYRVVPVNPAYGEVLGLRCHPDLLSVPDTVAIDVVDIFRRPEAIPEIVDQAIARGVGTVWMQRGIVHNAAAARARAARITVVMDRCIKNEHALLGIRS